MKRTVGMMRLMEEKLAVTTGRMEGKLNKRSICSTVNGCRPRWNHIYEVNRYEMLNISDFGPFKTELTACTSADKAEKPRRSWTAVESALLAFLNQNCEAFETI